MSRAYQTTEQVYAVFGELWTKLLADPDLSAFYERTPMQVALVLTNPDAEIRLTPGSVLLGPSADKADVEMRLDTETAHRFWLGRETLALLIAQGRIRIRGSSMQMLRLPALLKPGYALYPDICRAHGIPTEVS